MNRRVPDFAAALVLVAVLSGNARAATYGTDPAAVFAPRLGFAQVVVGPTNPAPPSLNIPVDFFGVVTLNQSNDKWKVGTVVGAVGMDVWAQPLGSGFSVAQNGWAGGTLNGGAATGTGGGIYYQPPASWGALSYLKFGLSGGVDFVSGQKAGLYAAGSAMGTIRF